MQLQAALMPQCCKSIKKSLPLQLCCNRVKRKNTPTKQAVLALLTESGKAMSQDTIEERITIKINQATIYRILNQFCEDGMRWS
jgi:Fe2+ or Zn2+ uptake regulation protein